MKNQITITAYVGKEDRIKKAVTQNGKHYVSFPIAEKLKEQGKYQYYDCTFWQSQEEWATNTYNRVLSSQMISLIGELSTQEGKDGKTYLKINVKDILLTTPRGQQAQPTNATSEPQAGYANNEADDDLPF
jgi:endo-beta-N-acetylglucosaminidase D